MTVKVITTAATIPSSGIQPQVDDVAGRDLQTKQHNSKAQDWLFDNGVARHELLGNRKQIAPGDTGEHRNQQGAEW